MAWRKRGRRRAWRDAVAAAIVALCGTTALWADDETDFFFQTLSNGAAYYSIDPTGSLSFHADLGIGYAGDRMYLRAQEGSEEQDWRGVFTSRAPITDGWPQSARRSSYYGEESGRASMIRHASISPLYGQFIGKGTNSVAVDPSDSTNVRLGDFTVSRVGAEFGLSWATPDARNLIGVQGGYSRGDMRQEFANNPYYNQMSDVQRIRARMGYTDFQFGAVYQHKFDNEVKLETRATGGAQSYRLNRWTTMEWDEGDYGELYSGNGTGNTLSVGVRMARDYELNENWTLIPTADFLSVHSWIFQASETGRDIFGEVDSGLSAWRPTTTAFRPYKLTRKLRYSRNTARVGAGLRFSEEKFSCDARAFYGTQLGGEDGPTVYGAQAEVENPMEQVITGSGYGRDSLILSGGAGYAFVGADSLQVRGEYMTVIYRKARKETVSATMTLSF